MLKFKAKKFSVVTRSCRLPNGYQTEIDMIIHPGAALVVPLATPDKVLFIRQYRPVIQKYLYELPTGT